GDGAICAASSGVFRQRGGQWTMAAAPDAAIPAKAVALGSAPERVYLLGRDRLFVSADGGATFVLAPGPPQPRLMTGMAVLASDPEIIVAGSDGRMVTSAGGGGPREGRGPGGAQGTHREPAAGCDDGNA